MNLKTFHSRQDIIHNYDFDNGKSNVIGKCWFMLPLESQLRNFVNGFGKITYFRTEVRDLEKNPYTELESEQSKVPFVYEMITDFVHVIEMKHPDSCKCIKCDINAEYKFIKLDGYDDCFAGVGQTYGRNPALVYDQDKIINKLMQDGMNEEEAYEYFNFNILGSYIDDEMPIFASLNVPLDDLDTK